MPPDIIAELGLPFVTQQAVVLADATEALLQVFEPSVVWDGNPRGVRVLSAAGAPLIGMALLLGYDLHIKTAPGGAVQIEALPAA